MSKRRRRRRTDPAPDAATRQRIDACTSPSELAALADSLVESAPGLAVRAYRKALDHAPGDGVLRNNLGVALWNAGDRGSALRAFEQAHARLPDDANVVQNVAGALLDRGHHERARQWFSRAASLTPGPRTLLAYVDLHGY